MRVLHVADLGSDSLGHCGAALLADALDPAHAGQMNVLLLGNADGERLLESLGVRTRDRIGCSALGGGRAMFAVRRYLRAMGGAGRFDVIHAWSVSSLTPVVLAQLGSAHRAPMAVTLTMGPASAEEGHWLAMLMAHGGVVHALAVSNAVKKAWVEAGVRPDAVEVVRPGIDLGRIEHGRRMEVRRSWGIEDETVTVVGFMGAPAGRMDAARAAHIVVLAALAGGWGGRIKLVAGPGCVRLNAGVRMMNALLREGSMVVDERMQRPWEIVPGLDVALVLGDDTKKAEGMGDGGGLASAWSLLHRRPWSGTAHRRSAWSSAVTAPDEVRRGRSGPGMLPVLYAAAAGKIIAGEASYALSEVVEHRHSGVLAKPGEDHDLALKLKQALEDRQLAWKIKDAARSEAFSFFARSRYRGDLHTVLGQVARGEKVAAPALPVTGGLRFAGIG